MNSEIKIKYFKPDDSKSIIIEILEQYLNLINKFDETLNNTLFLLEYDDKEKDKGKEINKQINNDSVIKEFKEWFSKDKFNKSKGNINLISKNIKQISKIYYDYKKEKDLDRKTQQFKEIYNLFNDIISTLIKLELEDKRQIALILNIFTNNCFFSWLQFPENIKLKTIRNIKAHDNLILDLNSFKTQYKNLSPFLTDNKTTKELNDMLIEIKKGDYCLLYDKNQKGNLSAILYENTTSFLKKIITICHLILYLLGGSKKLIFSRNLYVNYFKKKYDLNFPLLEFNFDDHLKLIEKTIEDTEEKDFKFN